MLHCQSNSLENIHLKHQSPRMEGFGVCQEPDDDLLWFRRHVNDADISLRRI